MIVVTRADVGNYIWGVPISSNEKYTAPCIYPYKLIFLPKSDMQTKCILCVPKFDMRVVQLQKLRYQIYYRLVLSMISACFPVIIQHISECD